MADAPAATPTPAAPAPAPAAPKPVNGSGKGPVPPGADRGADGKFKPQPGAAKPGNAIAEAARAAEPAKPEPPPFRYKDKLKVYGEEREVDLSQEEVRRLLQKGYAFDKELGTARDVQSKAEQLFKLAESNPEEFFRVMGKDPKSWAAEYLASHARKELMSPEERKAAELEEQLKALQAEKTQREAKDKQAADKARHDALVKSNEEKFIPALEKVGLPKSYRTLGLMAEIALEGLNSVDPATGKPFEFTPEQLAAETDRQVSEWVGAHLGELQGEQLLKRLGPAVVQRVVEAQIAALEAESDAPPLVEKTAPKPKEEKPVEWIDEREARRRLRAL